MKSLDQAIKDSEQCSNIRCHINMLLEPAWRDKLGISDDRELHICVMRILCDYNKLREEMEQVRKLLAGSPTISGAALAKRALTRQRHRFIPDSRGGGTCKACYGPRNNGNHIEL